ncbi:calcium-binding protein [Nostoc sp.]|uniref:calcium-binding protein n=1 Tax=Nostoc sp. TaxID=1180 RepID=UPI002FF74CE4
MSRKLIEINTLKISFGGVTDSVILKDQVYDTYDYGVEKITFSNGTIWNEAQLQNAYLTLGAATLMPNSSNVAH